MGANFKEKEIDQRVKDFFDMEDIDIIPDLRVHNSGRQSSYDTFWTACDQVLNDEIVDDRRHDLVTHLASVVSVHNLWERAKALCPDGTAIPSQEWLRLQFWPTLPLRVKFLCSGMPCYRLTVR